MPVMELEPGMWQAIEEERLRLELIIAQMEERLQLLQIDISEQANAIQRERLEWERERLEQELEFERERLAFNREELELRETLAGNELEFRITELESRMGQADQDRELRREELESNIAIAEESAAQERRVTELGLATSPIDYVAYELYKREIEGAGYDPYGTVHTDPEIQAMLAELTGIGAGGAGMAGEFGAYIPTTQEFSRSGFLDMSPDEQAILSSFLRAGATPAGGEEVSLDPQEYFREMEEGFVPVMEEAGPTRYRF